MLHAHTSHHNVLDCRHCATWRLIAAHADGDPRGKTSSRQIRLIKTQT